MTGLEDLGSIISGIVSLFTDILPTMIVYTFQIFALMIMIVPNVINLIFWLVFHIPQIFILCEIIIFGVAITKKSMIEKGRTIFLGNKMLFGWFFILAEQSYKATQSFINAVIGIIP